MLVSVTSLLVVALVGSSAAQSAPRSPCPNVFTYEPSSSEPGRWYGVVSLSTDSTLHSLWLNVVLDSRADILGNWVGDVTTSDNIDFKIENTKMKIQPGPATAVRFFIQYNPLNKVPRVKEIRLNGREICNANTPQPIIDRPDSDVVVVKPETGRPDRFSRPDLSAETRRPDTVVVETRPSTRPGVSSETKPVKGRPSGDGPVYVPTENPPINQSSVNLYSIGSGSIPVESGQSGFSGGSQSSNQRGSQNGYPTGSQSGFQTGSQSTNQPSYQSGSQPNYQSGNQPNSQSGSFQSGSQPSFQTGSRPSSQSDYQTANQPSFQTGSQSRPSGQTVVLPSYQGGSQSQNGYDNGDRGYTLTTSRPRPTSRPYDDDYPDSKPDPEDYFSGPRPLLPVLKPGSPLTTNTQDRDGECGRVAKNFPNPLIVNGKPTLEGQWPWQIALYQAQVVDNKYICGGTLVSRQHVVTAAHCVTLKGSHRVVNKNTLTVYLGKHNLRTSIEGVQIRFVGDITVHPLYNASSFARDLGVLKLLETVQYTEYVRPICLWPDDQVDLTYVIGKKGSVVGWGFDETGVATEELSLVEMPVVDQETCIRSYSEFFARFTSDTTFCAGYRDGTSVCNGDSGGGMVFNVRGTWYLRGLVSLSVARQADRCDPSHYVVFTDLAKFLPWIKEIVYS